MYCLLALRTHLLCGLHSDCEFKWVVPRRRQTDRDHACGTSKQTRRLRANPRQNLTPKLSVHSAAEIGGVSLTRSDIGAFLHTQSEDCICTHAVLRSDDGVHQMHHHCYQRDHLHRLQHVAQLAPLDEACLRRH